MSLTIKTNFPNVIVFTHGDMDGVFSAMAIKEMYDNNLFSNSWDRNVNCYICGYTNKIFKSLDWFKEKVEESFVPEQENIVFMTDYAIQPNNLMVQFWNWLTDKKCKFYWIDHHITAIEQLKHLNIPGKQDSSRSGCLNTWEFLQTLKGNNVSAWQTDENAEKPPMCLRFANDFDIWNKQTEYSWEKQLHPLCCFVESLGLDLNNNEGELVQTLYTMLNDNNYTNSCINIGKFIWRHTLNRYALNLKNVYEIEWNDYFCLCLNSAYIGSTQFEQHEKFNEADLLITWKYSGNSYQYGLYSTKPNINCGEIAKMFFNGGGHKGAAGGESKQFIFHTLPQ
jgi:oligoribonuclease NrnB/cAMP/cGMP phosphodiesterase (DHH superfamily)